MANVRVLRSSAGITYADLSERLRAFGRPIPVLGLSRLERGERRVDVDDLVALVRREIDPRNRRAILLHLTERGTAVRDDLRQARRRAAEDLFAPLSAEDREALGELLAVLDDGVAE